MLCVTAILLCIQQMNIDCDGGGVSQCQGMSFLLHSFKLFPSYLIKNGNTFQQIKEFLILFVSIFTGVQLWLTYSIIMIQQDYWNDSSSASFRWLQQWQSH